LASLIAESIAKNPLGREARVPPEFLESPHPSADFDLQFCDQVIAHANVEKAFYLALINFLIKLQGLHLLELLQALVFLLEQFALILV
jgi:hypothetical protein